VGALGTLGALTAAGVLGATGAASAFVATGDGLLCTGTGVAGCGFACAGGGAEASGGRAGSAILATLAGASFAVSTLAGACAGLPSRKPGKPARTAIWNSMDATTQIHSPRCCEPSSNKTAVLVDTGIK